MTKDPMTDVGCWGRSMDRSDALFKEISRHALASGLTGV